MFSPVGSQPSSVYWRRRIFVFGSLVVLVVLILLTVRVVGGGGGQTPVANGSVSGSGATTSSGQSSSVPASTSSAGNPSTNSAAGSSSKATSATVVPVRCTASDLAVQAVPGQTKYQVGQNPVVSLQVTNTSARPCVQDLADKQVVLKVYNGESRVWSSHDCEVQAGTAVRTLPMGQPVRVSITWSGSTSQVGCKGTRQRVGAGTYTLYAQLSGTDGKAARFTIG